MYAIHCLAWQEIGTFVSTRKGKLGRARADRLTTYSIRKDLEHVFVCLFDLIQVLLFFGLEQLQKIQPGISIARLLFDALSCVRDSFLWCELNLLLLKLLLLVSLLLLIEGGLLLLLILLLLLRMTRRYRRRSNGLKESLLLLLGLLFSQGLCFSLSLGFILCLVADI